MATTSSTKIENLNNPTNPEKTPMEGSKFGGELRSAVSDIVGEDKMNKANEFVGRAQDSAAALKDKAQQLANQVQERASGYVDDASEYLRRFPIQSVLIGFGVGILIGALVVPRRTA